MRIKVLEEVRVKEGTSSKGKAYRFRLQGALVKLGEEVRKFFFELGGDEAPRSPGEYEYEPNFVVNQYGELALGRGYKIVSVSGK